MARSASMSQAGFSLMELIVAMAILSILTAAIAPLVIQYVGDSRGVRGGNDAEALAQALQNFNVDTALWPVSDDATLPPDANEISRLVGAGAIPAGCVAAGDGWSTLAGAAGQALLEDYLVRNRDLNTAQLYVPSANPLVTPGWRGPYVPNVPDDPWGNPYVVNVRHIDGTNIAAGSEADHAVFVLSAGPDGCFDTPLADGTALPSTGVVADDVGALVEGNIQ